MPEAEAKVHLKRCVDSGLWVPDASKMEKEKESNDEAAASSSSDAKTKISTEDVD